MTWLARFTCFFFALALSCLSAAAYLVHQYNNGIPLAFVTDMALALLFGIVVPTAAVAAFVRISKSSSARARFAVYYGTCLALIALLALLTF